MKLYELLLRNRVKSAVIMITLALLGCLIYFHREEISREAVLEFGTQLPAVGFIALFLVLPLFGFPLSIFLFLAGLRFGFAGGMAVSAAAVIFHHLAAFRLVHGFFRMRVIRFLDRFGYTIPPIKIRQHVKFTALLAIIRGPPYFAKLYGLALMDIPFRIYFQVGVPIYILLCAIPVGAGSAVTQFDATWIYIIIIVLAIVSLVGYWLRRRIAVNRCKARLPQA